MKIISSIFLAFFLAAATCISAENWGIVSGTVPQSIGGPSGNLYNTGTWWAGGNVAWAADASGTSHALMAHAGELGGNGVIGWVESGAIAGKFVQTRHWDSPVIGGWRSEKMGDPAMTALSSTTPMVLFEQPAILGSPLMRLVGSGTLTVNADGKIPAENISGLHSAATTGTAHGLDGNALTQAQSYLGAGGLYAITIGPYQIYDWQSWLLSSTSGHALTSGTAVVLSGTIAKSQAGLGNVDNTSDADKPISTAAQTAINLKQDAASAVTLSGTQTLENKTLSSPTLSGTVAGSIIGSGTANRLPNQLGVTEDATMTRLLVTQNTTWEIGRVWRPAGTPTLYQSGTGATASASGVISRLRSPNTGITGYAHSIISPYFNKTADSGASIYFSGTLGLAFRCSLSSGDSTGIGRITLGGGVGATPAYSDAAALTSRGVGIEFRAGAGGNTLEYRIIAHNGTAFVSSAWGSLSATGGVFAYMVSGKLYADCTNNILYVSVTTPATQTAGGRISATEIASLPVAGLGGNSNASGVYASAVTHSTTPSTTVTSFTIYDMSYFQF